MRKLPIWFERAESAMIFVAASGLFFALHGNVVKYVILLIAIDISMLGYLMGPKVGAIIYNLFHSYILPLACIGVGLISYKAVWFASLGLVWVAHIGLDRALGMGLKYPSGFGYTTLGTIGKAKAQKG